jgi:hypothetical protein
MWKNNKMGDKMSVKEDWRRPQTVSDAELEENWKLMFGTAEPVIEVPFVPIRRQDPTFLSGRLNYIDLVERGYAG